ncbi:hypothetical protein GH714_014860 [Hevea brasiliensis]|uniref:FAS1 domain-containing protein n=1 Tax=Hevea brasiliensis TaxID=3981 RepID=A0A6A6LY34_HEVBR|nr:hypothetical protein GH714_001599 [Hevea brasiliensis]KAF2322410.1 hypothetical protein GH714_014860 [Hevea brasiliensis]
MALTLQITSKSLNLDSSAATIFAPCDHAFVRSGQPSILKLQYHISPMRLTRDGLNALPIGTRIPTLLPNHSLVVTSSSCATFNTKLSINGVSIQELAILDNRSVVIYGINHFFNDSFEIPLNLAPAMGPSSMTGFSNESENGSSVLGVDSFRPASEFLVSRGYSIMATFLDLQLFGFRNETRLTIFTPTDEAIEAYARNINDYSFIFRGHVVPGLFSWQDLVWLNDGTSLQTFAGGFVINVTRSGDVVAPNGVLVIFPDMYYSEGLIMHGLNGLLMKQEKLGDSFSALNGEDNLNQPDYGENGAL